ncbi:MAG: HlyD family type I secretion periplasmic adaptor subunit [Niveispirillum sp.]|uniref:HlyD family type I secretion periplasmic adaptor subunit n=1 Tax=Niveispirillum sp. TaxID=1917217 RepID=UPI00403672EA
MRTAPALSMPAPPFATDEMVEDPGVRPLTRAAILLSGVSVAAFIAWASLTPVQEVAVSFGEIVPAGAVQIVQHLEGGIVAEMLVRQGEMVEPGQPLLRFQGAATQSSRDQMLVRQRALRAQAERLGAFADGREPDFSAFSDNPDLMAENARLLSSQIEAWDNQRKILADQAQELRSLLQSSQAQLASVNTNLGFAESKVALRADLVEKGLNSKLLLIEAERERAAAMSERQRLEGVIAGTRSNLSGNASRLTELDGRLRQEALDKLGAVNTELAELEKMLDGQEDRVERLVSTAPARGIVQELPVKTVGGVISPGGVVARLVRLDDELVADVRVSPRDIGFVKVGQPVKVKIQAFDYTRFGRVEGTLESVSPTTFLDEQKQPYYQARVRLGTNHVGNADLHHVLVAGMTVQADITTGEKSLIQSLLPRPPLLGWRYPHGPVQRRQAHPRPQSHLRAGKRRRCPRPPTQGSGAPRRRNCAPDAAGSGLSGDRASWQPAGRRDR